jgi:hypothetical protein
VTSAREAFSDLDSSVGDTVRFGDGSVVQIEGCGVVKFSYKNGQHCTLGNVYSIPCLTINIISCEHLDEIGYQILIQEGVMRVCDKGMRLLAKILRSLRRLCMLDIDLAHPIYLSVVVEEDVWHWHACFVHVNFGTLQKMAREGLVWGLSILSQVE